jgi:inosose dehydratase
MAAERVLVEMRELGVGATEFGPPGFLPEDPQEKAGTLARHGLAAVGGFLPVLLHDPDHDPLAALDEFIDACLAAGASVVVLAAFTGVEGYDARPTLDEGGWRTLLANLDRLEARARERGVVATLHPHVGTMVEREDEVERVLAGSGVGLCLDTGHLLVGITHVHLKDVDAALAAKVQAGDVAYGDAIWQGLFRPLGEGDVDVVTLVQALEAAGYTGWYVLEQDIKLESDPDDEGPVAGVRTSLAHLRGAVS